MDEREPNLEGIDLSVEDLEPEPGETSIAVEDTHEDDDASFSHVAAPDRRLITQPYDLSVRDLVGQVGAVPPQLHVSPVYQRRYVWDNKKASKLIESLLINVPIPVAYLAEEKDGTRSVIDGQQRIRSLFRFINGQFALTGLEVLSELNRKRFQDLSDRQQRLIGNRTIRCIVISEDSDPDIRFDVFERLNTGSVALNAQELRNSVYRGPFNDLLRRLAKSKSFLKCVGDRTDTRMTFEELALRFFALDDGIEAYRPSLKRFLTNYMASNRWATESDIRAKETLFLETMDKVLAVYGDMAFRRAAANPVNGEPEWLPNINSAVFDLVTLNFAACSETAEEFGRRGDDIVAATQTLMREDEPFSDAISLATGDRTRVHRRVGRFAQELTTLGFDSGLASLLPPEISEDPA